MSRDKELDLFAYARTTDPGTSHEAAASVSDEIVSRLQAIVWRAILGRGDRGATWDELGELTGVDKASISPRFKPLRKLGLIESRADENGKEIKRPGKSGRNQIVWFAT